jgi:NAD(P)-dependent dehydrogenase (short-subunit alcohol dehydrogenase family)
MSKVMLVTGGSGGIGRAIVKQAVERDYAVCVHYRAQREKAEAVVREALGRGGKAIAVQGDAANEDDMTRLFETMDRELGRIDVLVNNVGVLGWQGRIVDCTAEKVNQLWAVNVTSYFLCAREAVRRMSTARGGKGGVIVNVSSIAGRRGGRDQRIHYATSKGAINTFTLGLAKEVAAEGIRVNAILPGFILTEFHDEFGGQKRADQIAPTIPMKRVGTTNEVADAVMWLATDQSSFVTSALVDIAGGS